MTSRNIFFFIFTILYGIQCKNNFQKRFLFEKTINEKIITIDRCKIKRKNFKSINLLLKYQKQLLPNLMNDKRYAIIILSFQSNFEEKNISKIIYKVFDKNFNINFIGLQFNIQTLKIKKYIQSDDLSEIKYLLKLKKFENNIICKNFAYDLRKYFKKNLYKFIHLNLKKKKKIKNINSKNKEINNHHKKKTKVNTERKIIQKKKWKKKKVQYHMKNLLNGNKIDKFEKLSIKILNALDLIYGYNIYKKFFRMELKIQKENQNKPK